MVDIFTVLLCVISVGALAGAAVKVFFSPPKVWDDEDSATAEFGEISDYAEIRKENPHIWMN